MWQVTKNLMRQSRRSMIPAGIAVAVCAMLLAAVFLASGILVRASVQTYTSDFGAAQYIAEDDTWLGVSTVWTDDGHPAQSLGTNGLGALGDVDGVDDTRVEYSESAQISATEGQTRMVNVIETSAKNTIMPYSLTTGAWPTARGQVALDESTARLLGVTLGDTIEAASTYYGTFSGTTFAGSEDATGYSPYDASSIERSDDGGITITTDVAEDGTKTTVTYTADEVAQLNSLADATLTLTVTGLYDEDSGSGLSYLDELGGGLSYIVISPDDMTTLYKAEFSTLVPSSKSEALTASAVASWTHDDLQATRVYYSLADGADGEQVKAAVLSMLGSSPLHGTYRVMSRAEAADMYLSQNVGTISDVSDTTWSLLALALVAVFITELVISNTLNVLVAQRRRTLALLRTVGASRSQVRGSVLAEGAMVGLAYSIIGTGLMHLILWLCGVLHVNVGGTDILLVPNLLAVIVPIVITTCFTVIGSIRAATLATQVSPMEALRPIDTTEKVTVKRATAIIAAILAVGGTGVCVWTIHTMRSGGDNNVLAGEGAILGVMGIIGGGMLAFAGLLLSANVWMPWLLAGFGRLASRVAGAPAIVAQANIRRNPHRVESTGTALLIAVTLVALVATAGSCMTTAMNAIAYSYLSYEEALTGGSQSDAMLRSVRNTPGVLDAVRITEYRATTKTGGTVSAQTFGNCNSGTVYVIPDGVIGHEVADVFGTDTLEDGTIYIGTHYENIYSCETDKITTADGDSLTLTFNGLDEKGNVDAQAQTSATLTVRTVDFKDDGAVSMAISEGTAQSLGITSSRSAIWMDLDNTLPATTVYQSVSNLEQAYPDSYLYGAFEISMMMSTIITIATYVMAALLLIAVVIALIGVASTLSLSVIERERESATLRAIGMSNGQLKASLAWESALIAVGMSIVGIILGTLYGWGLASAYASGVDIAINPNWGAALGLLAVAVVAAMLASVMPARRALRVSPVEALAEAD